MSLCARLDLVECIVGVAIGHQDLPNDEQHGEQNDDHVLTAIDELLVCFVVVMCVCIVMLVGCCCCCKTVVATVVLDNRAVDECTRKYNSDDQDRTAALRSTEKGIDCPHSHASLFSFVAHTVFVSSVR